MAESRSVTEVAVAVLTDPETGKVLLGSRPEGKPYAGWWELPGGKLEPGESVHEALVRELKEELALTVTDSVPWFVMEKSYPHAYVRLHFRRTASFLGTPVNLENQEFRWVAPEDGDRLDLKLLPMVALVLRRLTLPAVMATATSRAGLTAAADFVRSVPDAAVWVKTQEEAALVRSIGAAPFLWSETVPEGAVASDFEGETTALFGVGLNDAVTAEHANRLCSGGCRGRNAAAPRGRSGRLSALFLSGAVRGGFQKLPLHFFGEGLRIRRTRRTLNAVVSGRPGA